MEVDFFIRIPDLHIARLGKRRLILLQIHVKLRRVSEPFCVVDIHFEAPMLFLNPLVLLGLAAAAIPILLHLFNLRKLERIDFSTLAFLKELQKTKIRRLKLRQLLLLALRTILIALIVTAFSRPTLKTSYVGGVNAQAKTTAILVIDNSYSMTSVDEGGQLLKQAKEGAAGILQYLKIGDEVFVVPGSDVGPQTSPESISPLRDFAAVRAEIESIEPSYVHRTIEDALRFASRLMSTSKNLNKEIYVFSDFKKGSLRNSEKLGQPESLFPPETRFFFLPMGKKARENLGVTSVTIENALFGIGNPLKIRTTISNWGTQDVKNDVVSVFLAGTRVAQKALDVPAQNSAETEFTVTPTSAGFLDGTVELQDDDLDFDNHRPFAVNIPEQLKVLLVGNSDDLRFLRLALSAQPLQGESTITLSSVPPDRLSTNEIEAADVIVFANVKDLSSAQRDQIRSFVGTGGGVVYFPGSQTDSTSFHSYWSGIVGVPAISLVTETQKQATQTTSVLEFDKIDYAHPMFEGMFEEEQMKQALSPSRPREPQRPLESPGIYTHVRYTSNVQSVPIITLSDGSAFVTEQNVGRGIVILFSVSAITDWSEFPTQGLFVPMVHSAVSYAAQRHSLAPEVTAGEEADLALRNLSSTSVVVQNPEKVDIAAEVTTSATGSEIHFRKTSLPGIYSVRTDHAIVKQFVVTLDPEESNTVRADTKTIASMLRQLGVSMKSVETIDHSSEIRTTIIQSRVGIELWKYFVAAALLVALIESLVARTGKRDLSLGSDSSNALSEPLS